MSIMECKLNVHNTCVIMCHYMCCYTSKIPKHLKAIQSTKLSNDWGPTASALWEALSALAESKELGFPPAWMQIKIYCEGNSFCSFFVIFMQLCSSQVPSRMMDQNYWPSNSSLPYWFWDLNKNIIFWLYFGHVSAITASWIILTACLCL